MDNSYNSVIEALIFSSEEPLTDNMIIKSIKEIDGEDVSITPKDVEGAVSELNELYNGSENSFHIVKIAGGYMFATRHEYANYLGYLASQKNKRRLSQAALETLAIIAYKQPITKPEIETIRGVNSDYMINTLLEKSLVSIKGRADTVGKPLLYVTTQEFLMYFGLNSLDELPKPREIDEIMKDKDFEEQKRKIMMNYLEETMDEDIDESEEN